MKSVKALLPVCLLLASPAMALTNIGSAGDIHFTLTIKEATCELQQENIEVEMGSVQIQRPVVVGRELNQKKFTIGLKDCAFATQAKVTMDGNVDTTDHNLFAIDEGGATGIALKIMTNDGVQQYPVATDSAPVEHIIWFDNTNTLNYTASYVAVKQEVTTGAANATLNFTVQYE
jgi:P pilus assembly protein, pilin FimA